jgi:hypothetical protein
MLRALLNALVDELPSEPVHASIGANHLAGWEPVLRDCHGNADRWVVAHPGDTPVRVWLHEPFTDQPHRFVAHSLVRTAPGALIDVTLPAGPQLLRFLTHAGQSGFFLVPALSPALPRAGRTCDYLDEFLIVLVDDASLEDAGAGKRAVGLPEEIA